MALYESAPDRPDLHLVFDWEDDLCLLTLYRYSERDSLAEVRQSVNYYNGLEKRVRSRRSDFGNGRHIDAGMDLSSCSPEECGKILATPEARIQEIEDRVAGQTSDIVDHQFQSHAFDLNIRAVNPTEYTREDEDWVADTVEHGHKNLKKRKTSGSSHTGSKGWIGNKPATDFDKLYNGLNPSNPGYHNDSSIKVRRRRDDAPWWILNEEKFHDFAKALVADQGFDAGLDYAILQEFYLLGHEDQDIFLDHKQDFANEKHRQRRTSSVAALKKRRQRLLQKGNQLYWETEQTTPISQPRQQARPVKRRFGGLVGR